MRLLITIFIIASMAIGCKETAKTTAPKPADNQSVTTTSEKNPLILKNGMAKFKGMLPCKDCEGIKTITYFMLDGSFKKSSEPLRKPRNVVIKDGSWQKTNNGILVIDYLDNSMPVEYYKLTEDDHLIQVSSNGSAINDDKKYRLSRNI